jgi:hypothetical protein
VVQSATTFDDQETSGHASFAQPVRKGDLLVALLAVAGGNTFQVVNVTDSLGNTWQRAVAPTAETINGDESDAEIWYTIAGSSGLDTVGYRLGGASGWVQTNVTIAEFNGAGVPVGGATAASYGTNHSSGAVTTRAGDLVVGLYVDAGYETTIAPLDGKDLLGANMENQVAVQSSQSYGSGTSASFATGKKTLAQVTAAAFRPTEGSSGTPPPTPPRNSHRHRTPKPPNSVKGPVHR